MARVICSLPNAAEDISGVRFTPADGGMLSDDISEDQAAYFASIPGYVRVVMKKEPDLNDTKGEGDKVTAPHLPSKKASKP